MAQRQRGASPRPATASRPLNAAGEQVTGAVDRPDDLWVLRVSFDLPPKSRVPDIDASVECRRRTDGVQDVFAAEHAIAGTSENFEKVRFGAAETLNLEPSRTNRV
jgi:hypothetical protein